MHLPLALKGRAMGRTSGLTSKLSATGENPGSKNCVRLRSFFLESSQGSAAATCAVSCALQPDVTATWTPFGAPFAPAGTRSAAGSAPAGSLAPLNAAACPSALPFWRACVAGRQSVL